MAELDNEAETSEGLNPTGQYENCLSPGLDCAISVLVSLDSQAEVEQGIFLREVFLFLNQREATCLYCVKIQNLNAALPESLIFLLIFFQNLIDKDARLSLLLIRENV